MFSIRCRTVIVFSVCLLTPTLASSIQRCGTGSCSYDPICCKNISSYIPCCKPSVDHTYYNIAMVTRKLSGVLIMLLLFALGYFIQRMLCSKSRQQSPPHNGPPPVTTSQEMLMESCSRETLADPPLAHASAVKLPTYEECRDLPTYEETIKDGSRGRAGPSNMNDSNIN
ncbi:uncharacterized membrane protein C3orf80 homolog [Cyprinodon tularosa]|uniref:uncharacterized membrane protein C3orf80 homolog n=1 Tax=Cyprinodon tularosa TaxID=77115 RepID=UPI0018E23EBF|nr:uncharacterized membrane protein C3orf80 homolog [Cyprinodon tularosa]